MLKEISLDDRIKKVGGDPEFIRFLQDFFCKFEIYNLQTEKFSEAYLKRIKRRAIKNSGKEYWKMILKESLKPRLKMRLRKNLFIVEPLPKNPPHRPMEVNKWRIVLYLREYFKRITGKYQMGIIADILFPEKTYAELNSEWCKRKKRFTKREDGWIVEHTENGVQYLPPLKDLLEFFETLRGKRKINP